MTALRRLAFLLACALGCRQQDTDKPLLRPEFPPEKKTWRASDGSLYWLDRSPKAEAVVDGDTVRLEGLKESVRIAGVDAEEIFHGDADRKAAEEDFARYAREKRGTERRPVKFGTPEGEAAKKFAEDYFRGVQQVLYVPDDPSMPTEYYGRNLGHLLVDRDKDDAFEENFALELVRTGHSPYFVKYGISRLFHAEFSAAEEEARREKRGIWSDSPGHYSDYEERRTWWHARAKSIERFESRHAADPTYFRVQIAAEFERLKAKEPGAGVTLYGVISPRSEKSPEKVLAYLSYRNRMDIPIVWESAAPPPDLAEWMGEYVYVRGEAHPSGAKAGVEIRIKKDGDGITNSTD